MAPERGDGRQEGTYVDLEVLSEGLPRDQVRELLDLLFSRNILYVESATAPAEEG